MTCPVVTSSHSHAAMIALIGFSRTVMVRGTAPNAKAPLCGVVKAADAYLPVFYERRPIPSGVSPNFRSRSAPGWAVTGSHAITSK
jgi:hypothetical protein